MSRRRWALSALAAVSILGSAVVASADFRLTDPTAEPYYNYGLLAGAKLTVGERGTVAGNAHSNGTLELGERSTLTGNASAVGKLVNHGTVSGRVTSPAPAVTLPVLASRDDLRHLANRVLTGNQRLTNVVIDDILFVDGTVTLQGSIGGTGTLIATGDIQADEMNGQTPPLGSATRLSFIAFNDVKLGQGRALRGALYGGRDVTLGEQASFEGVVVARRNLSLGERSQLRFLSLDRVAPAIQVLQPPSNALLATAAPAIQASWTDNLSGVKLSTLRFLLDGTDRTAQAAVTATGLTFTPTPGLAEGAHTIDLTLADHAGNVGHAVSRFTTDTRPPAVAVSRPTEGQVFTSSPIQVMGTVTDASAIARVTVNGQPVPLSGGAFTASIPLTAGANTITVAATDAAGNVGQATVHATLQNGDTTPPAVAISSPTEGQTVTSASFQVTGTATDAGGVASVTVNGQPAALSGSAFTATVTLVDGANTITAVATDTAGNAGQAVAHVTLRRDTTPPRISLTAPVSGTFVLQARPEIDLTYGDADSGVDPSTLSFTANGAALSVTCQSDEQAARCTPSAPLPDGPLTLAASITDHAGNRASASGHYVVDTAGLTVTLTSPVDGLITRDDQAVVQGTVSAGITQVQVNGFIAALAGSFFSVAIPLREGVNMIVAVGTKSNGRTGASSVEVTRDLQAPIVRITSPRDGLVSISSHLAVTGQVNDTVTGGAVPRVTVNGVDAGSAGGSFMIESVELVPGPNTITAVATDAVGNSGEHSITVTYQPPAGNRVVLGSGNGQSAAISSTLPTPLVVLVQDDAGNPVAGSLVRFQVTRNSGTLRARAGDPPQRTLQVATDGGGRASVLLTLGDTSGIGNNRVRATALGAAGEVEFCASAAPGPAGSIVLESGDNQRGVIGQPLSFPLTVFVADGSGNPLPGVAVNYAVTQGTGNLDGGASTVRTTDADGLARAILMLGPTPGINNNGVTASVSGLAGLPVTFTSSGVAPGDPAQTSLSGVVLDDGLTPIPGVEVLVLGTSLHGTTDAQGQFSIQGTPVGLVHLHVDPSQSPRPETFPPLPAETVLIAGQHNMLDHPILLPKLALENSKIVGGPEDVTLTMAGVDGLALTVLGNSATFPDGSRTGQLTISQVHLDKVPSAPPMGGVFMPPAWSIQPPNVQFDPPARVAVPNDGEPPGKVVDIFQFDHELNQFIKIGTGTVSEDGTTVVSDPGFGILASGWGGFRPSTPPPTNPKHNPCDDAAKDAADVASNSQGFFDPTTTFANTQACIAQRGCASKPSLQDPAWLDMVMPKFINDYKNQTGGWPLVRAACDTISLLNPLRKLICSGMMATYHINVDLQNALLMVGCGTTPDWLNLQDSIIQCTNDNLPPGLSGIADQIVIFMRNHVRANCLQARGGG